MEVLTPVLNLHTAVSAFKPQGLLPAVIVTSAGCFLSRSWRRIITVGRSLEKYKPNLLARREWEETM